MLCGSSVLTGGREGGRGEGGGREGGKREGDERRRRKKKREGARKRGQEEKREVGRKVKVKCIHKCSLKQVRVMCSPPPPPPPPPPTLLNVGMIYQICDLLCLAGANFGLSLLFRLTTVQIVLIAGTCVGKFAPPP